MRNTHKVAYYTHDGTPASWTSKYGSITFNQNGKEMPYGGMNEKGLVVEMLWMDETQFNISEDKAYLNELEWIQYQLDNFHSIDEVIANIESFKVYPIQGKIHYLLADTHGTVSYTHLIRDNGIGLDDATITKGNGLNNMKQRAEKLKGKFKIGPFDSKGTIIYCEIPINIT